MSAGRPLAALLLVAVLGAGRSLSAQAGPAPSLPPPPAAAPAPASPAPATTTRPPQAPAALVPLGQAATRLGARLLWDPLTGTGQLERGYLRVSLATGMPFALVDYRERVDIDPPRDEGRGPGLTEAAIASLRERLDRLDAERAARFSVAAILIDPGHGGKDSGAVGEHLVGGKRLRVVEKEIALQVALMVRDDLRRAFPGRRVLISREGDSYPTLEDRVSMANEVALAPNEAIIYVSIHANASFNKNARGFEVWYLNPEYRRTLVAPAAGGGPGSDIAPILNAMLEEEFTTESVILARSIMKRLGARIGADSPDRGVRAEEWFVVRNAKMPSVLVEMGFVTNPEEAALLAREDYLRRVAEGVYTGIVDFVSYFENMKGPPAP